MGTRFTSGVLGAATTTTAPPAPTAASTADNTLTEALVKELAYLAGGVATSTSSLIDTLGWTVGTAVVDESTLTLTDGTTATFVDTMQIYTKESMCAVAFSATDDEEDSNQQLLGAAAPTAFCGAPDVNGGYAQEMQQYMEVPEWAQAIGELGACAAAGKTIYATGHSMGGAMASLFAFCVNTNDEYSYKHAFGGGQLPEINLVTIGAPSVSQTPLYNGDAGNCFKGTRQYVFIPPNTASQQFHVDNLVQFSGLAAAIGQTEASEQLRGASDTVASLDQYPSATASAVIQGASGSNGIGQLWLVAYSIMLNQTIPGYEALLPAYPTFQAGFGGFLQRHSSSLIYNYDMVPQLFDFAGYKHPLLKVEPQPHAVKGGSSIAATSCEASSDVPNEDFPQLFWGLVMHGATGGYGFPNHNMCCFIPDSDCIDRYSSSSNGSGLVCREDIFR